MSMQALLRDDVRTLRIAVSRAESATGRQTLPHCICFYLSQGNLLHVIGFFESMISEGVS